MSPDPSTAEMLFAQNRSATAIGRATERSKGGEGGRRPPSGDMSGVARPMAVARAWWWPRPVR